MTASDLRLIPRLTWLRRTVWAALITVGISALRLAEVLEGEDE